jgi:hypothetical protein
VGKKPPPAEGIVPTKLYSVNLEVDRENLERLAELPGVHICIDTYIYTFIYTCIHTYIHTCISNLKLFWEVVLYVWHG